MDEATRARLNEINRHFYEVTASEFDATRGRAWPGWERLTPYLAAPLRVLDVGCGNGRFGVFLAESLNGEIRYHGMDNNPALLDFARDALAHFTQLTVEFTQHDAILHPPDTGTYDLVVLFGVMHHVPGAAQRLHLMQTLAQRVADDGLLVIASWRFYEYERFRQRLTDWPPDIPVEAHDYLLDWRRGDRALRYCHYVDDAEENALIAASGLALVDRYRADGSDNRMNSYIVLRKTDA